MLEILSTATLIAADIKLWYITSALSTGFLLPGMEGCDKGL